MHLKILNPGTAATFGLPQTDCEYDSVIKQMTDVGWDDKRARAHLDAAIQAGAYIKEERQTERIVHSAPKEKSK